MILDHQITQIRKLHQDGNSSYTISKILGISIPTVYKYIKLITHNSEFLQKNKNGEKDISLKIQPFKEAIDTRVKDGVLNNLKIFKELQSQGFKGSYGLLNNYLQEKKQEHIVKTTRAYEKVETGPGEQGQVDWGHFGKITINNIEVNLYAFVYILSHSRMMYAEFTTSQRQQVWQNCHMNAFEKIGVPKKLRYDNVKTVVISRAKLKGGGERINYNFDFLHFSRYYRFEPELCPRYYPRSKGKVEAGVKYLRRNFMSGKIFKKNFNSIDEINQQLQEWLGTLANMRVHSTTKEVPKDIWLKEKEHLFIPQKDFPRYKHTCTQSRWSSQNCMVTYKKSSYWIPPEFARKKIDIEEEIVNGTNKLMFYFKGQKICEHIQSEKTGGWILPKDYKIKKGKQSQERKEEINKLFTLQVEKRDINYYDLL